MSKYTYCYLAGALFNLGLWAACYVLRKDLRRELWLMSGAALAMGMPHEYWLWTRDWWHPPTVFHTRVGFEDAMYAVGTGGTLATGYAVALRRRLVQGTAPGRIAAAMPLVINFILPFPLVLVAGLHSFVATTLGTCAALLWILPLRPDLIAPAAASLGLGLLISFPCYWFVEWLAPGCIAAIWDLPRLSGVSIGGIPIEDLAWYAYTAALFGIYYKYATGARFAAAAGAAPIQPQARSTRQGQQAAS